MRIIIAIKGEHALVFWVGNHMPFVTCLMEHKDLKVGDIIPSWYHGHYFSDLQEVLDDLNKRSGGNE